jgi:hypothetical protein
VGGFPTGHIFLKYFCANSGESEKCRSEQPDLIFIIVCPGLLILKNLSAMKVVYYKGQPYQYKIIESGGKRLFQLYENGVACHTIEQGELDIRSMVSFILDSYYKNTPAKLNTSVLS